MLTWSRDTGLRDMSHPPQSGIESDKVYSTKSVTALSFSATDRCVASSHPRHPILSAGLIQELAQLLEGQRGRARRARGYLVKEIEVVSNEDREVPGEGRLVDADEVPALPGSREETAPLSYRHQSDGVDTVREKRDEQLIKRGGPVKVFFQRLE